MKEVFYEVVWIVLALLAMVIAAIKLLTKTNDEVNWIILGVLFFIVSLQLYKIRKDEENK